MALSGAPSIALANPKSEHLHFAIRGDLHVSRLEIPMNDASIVCGFERLTNLLCDIESLFERNRSVCDTCGQRFAFYKLKNQKPHFIRLLQIVDGSNVRMI